MAIGAELLPGKLLEGINNSSVDLAVCRAADSAINCAWAAGATLAFAAAGLFASGSTVVVMAHAMSSCLRNTACGLAHCADPSVNHAFDTSKAGLVMVHQ